MSLKTTFPPDHPIYWETNREKRLEEFLGKYNEFCQTTIKISSGQEVVSLEGMVAVSVRGGMLQAPLPEKDSFLLIGEIPPSIFLKLASSYQESSILNSWIEHSKSYWQERREQEESLYCPRSTLSPIYLRVEWDGIVATNCEINHVSSETAFSLTWDYIGPVVPPTL